MKQNRVFRLLLAITLGTSAYTTMAQTTVINDYKSMSKESGADFFTIVRDTRAQLTQWKRSLPLQKQGKIHQQFREAEARFERWVWTTKGRVSKDGTIAPSQTGWNNYMQSNPQELSGYKKKSRSSSVWTNFSPYSGFQPNDTTYANGWTYGYGVGRINVVRQHPTNKSKLYAGSSQGGVFVSNNYGQSWAATTDQFAGLGVSDLVVDPANPNNILLATGDFDNQDYISSIGIFKSTDGGLTWAQKHPFTLNQQKFIGHIVYDPANSSIVLATTTDNVLKSLDGGETWASIRSSAG